MQQKSTLLFGIHLHQPIDNFDWVIKLAVESCYAPFFEVMSRYPEFKFAVHCSGWLMEQIEVGYPKLYATIQKLAQQGSIEFFSAGYYEPILSVIPPKDCVAQIEMLNQSLRDRFQQEPQGLWLTERVWESAIIPSLQSAGIKYSVIDDYHFECAGFDREKLDGYYMTEEGGEQLGLFPISKKLRYALPFLSVKSAIEAIKSTYHQENSAAIIFDDAEKFGMWPGTHEWVYEKGWLEGFVEAVIADKEIETQHYSEYFKNQKPRGIAYLPNVSYAEMGEWSLGADDALKLENFKEEMGLERYEKEGVKFLKGGIWKNFFVKYEESNRLHKRMLELSSVRESLNSSSFDSLLYKFQTNDALWHGVFGGLYLPNLRDNAYKFLIEAEKVRYNGQSSIELDHNEMDGYPKIKAVTPNYLFRFDGGLGGQLIEFDIFKKGYNWQNTLTRRKELYHQKILNPQSTAVEEHEVTDGIDTIHSATLDINETMRDALIYDWYIKNSLIDHITDESFTLESFRECNFRELGDFSNQPFETSFSQDKIDFKRNGGLYLEQKYDSKLHKSYFIRNNGFDFMINFSTTIQKSLQYALEFNLHFADYETLLINDQPATQKRKIENIKKVTLLDAFTKKRVTIALSQKFDLYFYPLETLSQSEKGFDLTIQAISLALVIPFEKDFNIAGKVKIK